MKSHNSRTLLLNPKITKLAAKLASQQGTSLPNMIEMLIRRELAKRLPAK